MDLAASAHEPGLSTPFPHRWRFGRAGFSLALALTMGACSTLSARQAAVPPVDLPTAWSGALRERHAAEATSADAALAVHSTGGASLAQWWSRFDDPLLTRLVDQALQANASVGGAQAALRQARSLREVSAAGLLPSVGGSASAQRSFSESDSGGSLSASGARNSFRAGLDASWEPDLFGVNRSALDSSEATAQASAASLGDVQVSVAAEVALAYIALRSAEVRQAIASDNLASQSVTLQITHWRLQVGLATSLEAEQARAAAEQTRAQLPALQTQIEQIRNALAVLTGQPPHALRVAVPSRPSAVPRAHDDLALSLPAETLRQRPDVRVAEYRVTAALARVTQADAARAPGFRLGGSIGLSALTLGSFTNAASTIGALLVSVSLPVFDGGAAMAQVRAQQAAWDQARYAYRATVLAALADVEDALVALRSDRERLVNLQNAAEAASNAALWARQRYDSGLTDFQTVLQTQRTQLSTQDSLAAAQADLSTDHVRLYKALGGGWIPDDRPGVTGPASETRPNPL